MRKKTFGWQSLTMEGRLRQNSGWIEGDDEFGRPDVIDYEEASRGRTIRCHERRTKLVASHVWRILRFSGRARGGVRLMVNEQVALSMTVPVDSVV